MAISFLPGNPKSTDPNSFFMKGWFKAVKDFCQNAFGLADIQTTTFTATDREFYPCNTGGGNIIVTLPPAIDINGKPYTFKKTSGSNTLTIQCSGTDTIEGAASYAMTANGATVTLRADGQGTWYIHSVGGTTGFLASPLTTKGDLWGYSTVDARVAVGSNGKVLTADSTNANGVSWQTPTVTSPGGADTNIQFNDGGAFGGEADFTWTKASNTLTLGASSTIAFGLTGRITGNGSSTTQSERLMFQSSVANGNTVFGVIPNGSSTTSGWRLHNNSDPTAALTLGQLVQSNTITVLDATILNGGTQGTMEFRIGGAAAVQIDATKNVQFKAGVQYPVATQATPYSVVETDVVVLGDATGGNVTYTLPAANIAGAGFTPKFIIKRIDSSANTFTIQRAGADTIDGGTTTVLGALGSVTLISDGVSAWYLV